MKIKKLSPWLASFLIAAAQFLVVLGISQLHLDRFNRWDTVWYIDILDRGYQPNPIAGVKENLAFFPGYPAAGKLVQSFFELLGIGISSFHVLLLVSFFLSVLVWRYTLSWGERFLAQANQKRFLLFCVLYPFTFFCVMGYTESLFLAGALGFVLFTEMGMDEEKTSVPFLALAMLHGFAMVSARFSGFAFSLYPLIRAIQKKRKDTVYWSFASIASLSAIPAFFGFLQMKFGQWDLYFITERKWQTFFDPSKLFPPTALFDFDEPLKITNVGRYFTILFAVWLAMIGIKIIRTKAWKSPLFTVWLTSGMFWGANLLGRTSANFEGMGRYLLPCVFISLPVFFTFELPIWAFTIIDVVMGALQIGAIMMFLRGGWVA